MVDGGFLKFWMITSLTVADIETALLGLIPLDILAESPDNTFPRGGVGCWYGDSVGLVSSFYITIEFTDCDFYVPKLTYRE